MKTTFFTFTIIFMLLISCNQENKKNFSSVLKTENDSFVRITGDSTKKLNNNGYNLLKSRCFICHQEQPAYGNHEGLTAPPMPGVKRHYVKKYPTKDDFVKAIMNWVKNPTKKNSIMKGAIEKFGIMPPFQYPDNELKEISEALYHLPTPKKQRHRKHRNGIH
jgi:hypothetical protein